MRGLTLIAVSADAARLHAALSLACAQAALGRPARLFLQAESVALLAPDAGAAIDARYAAAGLPRLADLIGEALAMDVRLIACQTGLDLAGLSAERLPEGIMVGGLVSLLRDAGDDQIVVV